MPNLTDQEKKGLMYSVGLFMGMIAPIGGCIILIIMCVLMWRKTK